MAGTGAVPWRRLCRDIWGSYWDIRDILGVYIYIYLLPPPQNLPFISKS